MKKKMMSKLKVEFKQVKKRIDVNDKIKLKIEESQDFANLPEAMIKEIYLNKLEIENRLSQNIKHRMIKD